MTMISKPMFPPNPNKIPSTGSLTDVIEEIRKKRLALANPSAVVPKRDPQILWNPLVPNGDPGDEQPPELLVPPGHVLVKAGNKSIFVPLADVPEGIKDQYIMEAEEKGPNKGQFSGKITLNEKQEFFVRLACDFTVKEIVAGGSAGTGKTTMCRAMYQEVAPILPKLGLAHKHLNSNAPAIIICAYTRRAVRNDKRALQAVGGSDVCATIHKVLEYAPEFYTEEDEKGEPIQRMRFSPSRHKENKLDGVKICVIDEAPMCSTDLFKELKDALPDDCRIIYIGDIYQLPPIYGPGIFGYKLVDAVDGKIPLVELTHVYRQALESPILRFALQVKDGWCPEFAEPQCRKERTWKSDDGHSVLKVVPLMETSEDKMFLNKKFGDHFANAVRKGIFDPDQDIVLIPHGKPHTFGSHQINLHIAQAITDMKGLDVHEVIAGFNKLYLCIGDKVAVGSTEGRVVEITRNAKYFGKMPRLPSKKINRWGEGKEEIDVSKIDLTGGDSGFTNEQIDNLLENDSVEDRKSQASHCITIELEDSTERLTFNTAGELNALSLCYALTVHRAQGSEWRNVFFVLHHLHAGMFSRELLYTAMTRTREKLLIWARPAALGKCVGRSKVKGKTLVEKAEYFREKRLEQQREQGKLLLDLSEEMEENS